LSDTAQNQLLRACAAKPPQRPAGFTDHSFMQLNRGLR
jgi:hypothetical protein